ncbi:MAG: hypothetical protein U0514_00165 [Candidatus Andersenbacteria bacterium]
MASLTLDYKLLFEHMLNGFAYCKMEYGPDGAPVDFTYLAVNPAFGRLTGLHDVVGKAVTTVIPSIRAEQPDLFTLYGRVASTGRPERTELFFKPFAMWFDLSVYSPQRGYFVAVFDNITTRKNAEQAARERTQELEKFNRLTVGRELKMVELKERVRQLEAAVHPHKRP